jgi:hypothetical protein
VSHRFSGPFNFEKKAGIRRVCASQQTEINMLRVSSLAMATLLAFANVGIHAFSLRVLSKSDFPAHYGQLRAVRSRAPVWTQKMKMDSNLNFDRRSLINSFAWLGVFAVSQAIIGNRNANAAGSPLSASEAQEYAKLLEEVKTNSLRFCFKRNARFLILLFRQSASKDFLMISRTLIQT